MQKTIIFIIFLCFKLLGSQVEHDSLGSDCDTSATTTDFSIYSILKISGEPKGSGINITKRKNDFSPRTFTLLDSMIVLDSLQKGYYDLEITKYGYESKDALILLFPGKKRIYNFSLSPMSQKKAITYSIFYAGTGQIYSGQTLKGYMFLLSETITLTGIIVSQIIYNDEVALFREQQDRYRFNEVQSEMDILYNQLKNTYDRAKHYKNLRNVFLAVFAVIHISNIVDMYINWPFDKSHHLSLQLDINGSNHNYVNISVTF